ncbi:MAG: pyruvate:ferredoxin (flavodoxin) oxidoreductase [Alphaproteobacteria bacterium]|nr:pyruvate:ferredoxin (flavodoxin) oxidoreductase [Alphaproteobacteria bacterium]
MKNKSEIINHKSKIIVDGNWAAADIAYRCSEFSAIYPITPSSTMGELADEWAFQHKKNIWGAIPGIIEMQSEGGAAGALHGALQMGAMCSTFTASQGLLLMIPNMYKIAGEQTPFVMHVAARAIATHALSIFGDHSDVMSVRGTGFAMLSAHSVQQAHDMAAIAHAATLRSRVPFLHFFDGFRTSHEESRIEHISDDVLRKLIPTELMLAARARGMTPDAPTIRGTAQNPDVFFQGREACNNLYDAVPGIVSDVMDEFAKLTGRRYGLVDYVGNPDAENIIVCMGSAAETITETLAHLPGGLISPSLRGSVAQRATRESSPRSASQTAPLKEGGTESRGVGVIAIHLYRPFPTAAFLAALPKTAKNIAVLDRTKEPGSIGEPLYQDVVTALQNCGLNIFGGRYGLGSKEFKPRDVKAIVEGMMRGTLHHNFTVGIDDDVTKLSLKTDPTFANDDAGYQSAILYGIGSDGTVGAVKNIVKIVGENSDLYPQSYAVYDSKKSGTLTASHLRFAPNHIRSQYLVEYADFISVSSYAIAQRFDVFRGLRPGGTVMINTSRAPDDAFGNLPRETQEHLIRMRAKVYFLDANRGADELGLGRRINTFIMLNFFGLTNIIDPKIAAESAKHEIEKTYKKKGSDVVAANWAAVDRASEFLTEYKLPSSPSNFAPDFIPAMMPDAPVRIAGVLGEIGAMRGNALPVSAFAGENFTYGEYPTGTSKYEKRATSERVAECNLNKCIQCGKCSMLCPHSAIRTNVFVSPSLMGSVTQSVTRGSSPRSAHADSPPQGGGQIPTVPTKTTELGEGLEFTLNVSPADCTGCGVCVKNCPVKALRMVPYADAVANGAQDAFNAATELPAFPRDKLNLNISKHIELCEHMFEFPGACAGCGETPYLKLVTQLFGDRMIVANATGCSSIFGANLPTTPYAKNSAGRGPAWSNSLFEDNAEYGLGMRLALNQKRHALKGLLFELQSDGALKDINIEKLFEEKNIDAQRGNAEKIKSEIRNHKSEIPAMTLSLLDCLVDKSVWIIGGDGWAYDIGFGGLDHVLHSGQNVNILVMDTEGYSNTGGQQSKATPFGASMKFAVGGKDSHKKDLGLIAMMSGAYVAQIAMGADQAQAIKAIREAEAFPGPSIILAYAHCVSHGFDLSNGPAHQRALVDSGAWPLYRFNPAAIERGENPLVIDSGANLIEAEKAALEKFLATESRFNAANAMNPTRFAKLVDSAVSDNEYRRELKKHIAAFALSRKSE